MRTLSPLAPFLLAAAASGQALVTGQVVDGNGVGVPGVDLDFFDAATGDEESGVSNDGTNAGGFFATTVPPGTYDIQFLAPPAASLAPKRLEGVTISTTTAIGVVPLAPGFVVSATFLRPGGIPAFGAELAVLDAATGEPLPVLNPTTDAAGFVQAVVPAGTFDLLLDTGPVLGPIVAPWQSLDVSVSAAIPLGTVALAPGFLLSASVFGNGAPVDGADLDVRPAAGGSTLYTPGDGTDSFGFVDAVVPAGTYEIEIDAPLADRLVSALLPSVSVSSATALGTIVLPPGLLLDGTVTALGGGPLSGVDIDVRNPTTNALVPTSSDDTNPAGTYAVIVPAGTWNVKFTPIGAPGYHSVLAPGIAVSADTVLNASLPSSACLPPASYGTGTAGSGGISPSLTANNPAFPGNSWFAVRLAGGLGGAPAITALGLFPTSLPALGGTILVSPVPFLILFPALLGGPAGVGGVGEATLPLPLPADPSLVGGSAYLQGVVVDSAGPAGFALTTGLSVTLCL